MSTEPDGKLSDQGVTTLAALVRVIAELDGFVTVDESEAMNAISEWAGEERFWAAFKQAREGQADLSDLESLAATIDDEHARRSIYGMLRLLVVSDGTAVVESAALERLRVLWELPAPGAG